MKAQKTVILAALCALLPPFLLAQNGSGTKAAYAIFQESSPEASGPVSFLDQVVSLDLDNVTVEEALGAIAQVADFQLAYSSHFLPNEKRVSYAFKEVSAKEALQKVFEGVGVNFVASKKNKRLIITPQQRATPPTATVTGTVTDAETGKPLIGSNVIVEGTRLGSATNEDGEYVINNVPEGEQTITADYIGYASSSQTITVSGSATLDFSLQRSAIGLEELIVTARRRGENLQETPLSVSAFSAENLVNRNADNLRDIMQFAPNVLMIEQSYIGAASGNAFIRGIGQLDYVITTDPGVGTYIDGVYMARSMGLLQSLIDVERIEVLRGPQGTLYGKNTIGGAIRIVSAKPNNEYSSKVEFTGGRFTRADIKADINVPLINDRLFVRIAGGSTNRDGYGHTLDMQAPGFNRQDGIDRGDDQGLVGRLQLRWLASENITVDFSLDGSRQRSHQPPGTLTAIYPDSAHPLLGIFFDPPLSYSQAYESLGRTFDLSQITGDPFVSRATGPQQSDMDAWGHSTVIDWQAGDINIKSITAYRELKTDIGNDADHTEFDLLEQEELNNQDQFSQEVQISGWVFDDRLSWVFGAYYMKENADRFILGHILGDFWRAGLFPQVIDTGVANDIMASAKTFAGFGQGTFKLTDQLGLTAGVRVSSEKKTLTGIQRGFFARVENDRGAVSDSWTSVSPRFGIEYQWTDDVMSYLSAARGFKSGGHTARLNPGAPNAGIVSYDPEHLWTYEGGIRSDFARGRARANLTGFYSDYTDIQVTFLEFIEGQLFTGLANVASARIKGAEFEFTAMPVPGLVLNSTIGYIDAKYTAIGPTATEITPDSRFPRTPKWSFSLGGQYERNVTSGSVLFRADYSYRSSTQAAEASNVVIDQDGFGLLSARIAYKHGEEGWKLAVFMTNITDERYIIGGSELEGMFAQTHTGRPREWGLQALYQF